MAALLPVQIALGMLAERITDRALGERLIAIHVQLGVALLALTVWRLGLRLGRGAPVAPRGLAPRAWRAARAAHGLIYLLLIVLPLSGYVMWVWFEGSLSLLGLARVPALFTRPADDETLIATAWWLHLGAAWALGVLIALHAGAALWHEFVRRDGLIRRRML